jgi:hypothetical protein
VIIPTPSVQTHIASVMEHAYLSRREALKKAREVTERVSDDFLRELGINTSIIKHEKSFILKTSELSWKWRVENNDVRRLSEALHQGSYQVARLGDFATFVTTKTSPKADFKYIEIGHIDVTTGRIDLSRVQQYGPEEAPNNAQRRVQKEDILISTRRPTRGAVTVVPDSLDNEFCTLFFSIVRLNETVPVLPEYVSAFLRTFAGRVQFQQAITETTYPVISDADVANLLVPLPPVEIQKKLASELSVRLTESERVYLEADRTVSEAKKYIEGIILGATKVA